jgi:hypothetical protein
VRRRESPIAGFLLLGALAWFWFRPDSFDTFVLDSAGHLADLVQLLADELQHRFSDTVAIIVGGS